MGSEPAGRSSGTPYKNGVPLSGDKQCREAPSLNPTAGRLLGSALGGWSRGMVGRSLRGQDLSHLGANSLKLSCPSFSP